MSAYDYSIIKPKAQRHFSTNFKSTLEARWAIFFNTLKIEWIYEPKTWKNIWYRPDFLLPDWDLFCEIKPPNMRPKFYHNAMIKCKKLAYYENKQVILLRGGLEQEGIQQKIYPCGTVREFKWSQFNSQRVRDALVEAKYFEFGV